MVSSPVVRMTLLCASRSRRAHSSRRSLAISTGSVSLKSTRWHRVTRQVESSDDTTGCCGHYRVSWLQALAGRSRSPDNLPPEGGSHRISETDSDCAGQSPPEGGSHKISGNEP